jgi:hypothetical protein
MFQFYAETLLIYCNYFLLCKKSLRLHWIRLKLSS